MSKSLSLVAFMDDRHAVSYLRNKCRDEPIDEIALLQRLQKARDRLRAGSQSEDAPEILAAPKIVESWARRTINSLRQKTKASRFKLEPVAAMIEIRPLLAHQISVSQAIIDNYRSRISGSLSLDELLSLCLPENPPQVPMLHQRTQNSIVIQSKGLGIQSVDFGLFPGNIIGLELSGSSGQVEVMKYNEDYVLFSGYHRVCALAESGIRHCPCLLWSANSWLQCGFMEDGSTLSATVMMREVRPRINHFVNNSALHVDARNAQRIFHVNWSEYVIMD